MTCLHEIDEAPQLLKYHAFRLTCFPNPAKRKLHIWDHKQGGFKRYLYAQGSEFDSKAFPSVILPNRDSLDTGIKLRDVANEIQFYRLIIGSTQFKCAGKAIAI